MLLTFILALLIGLALGLLGGGGSILTVPVLLYAAGAEPRAAIAMSLFVVAAASGAGLLQHARKGGVEWGTGLIFGTAGLGGAYLGGRLSAYLPASVLVLLFAATMIAAGVAMLRRQDVEEGPSPRARAPGWRLRLAAAGFGISLFTGMVGAGGGFLIVPVLMMVGGLDTRRSIGTSLLVITLSSTAGLLGHLGHTRLDPALLALVTSGAVLGTIAGARLGRRVRPSTLRKAFGGGVLVVALLLIAGELRKLAVQSASTVAAPAVGAHSAPPWPSISAA